MSKKNFFWVYLFSLSGGLFAEKKSTFFARNVSFIDKNILVEPQNLLYGFKLSVFKSSLDTFDLALRRLLFRWWYSRNFFWKHVWVIVFSPFVFSMLFIFDNYFLNCFWLLSTHLSWQEDIMQIYALFFFVILDWEKLT